MTQSLPSGARYHEKLASAWNAGYAQGAFRRRGRLANDLLRETVKPGSRWLDVGCGAGVLTQSLAKLGATGDAVDGSPAMIDAALKADRTGTISHAFSFRLVTTVERLESKDATYDGVLCSSVIEYLEDPESALFEIARVLRPGGRLLISVANRWSAVRWGQRMVRAAGQRQRFTYLDVSRATYSRRGVERALRDCGIHVDMVRGFDPVIPRWAFTLLPPSLLFVVGTKVQPGDARR